MFENTSGGRFEGQEAIRAVFTRAFELMSTGWFETEEPLLAGDRCIVLWTYIFNRLRPEQGQVRGIDVFRVRDGLVAEKFSYVKSEVRAEAWAPDRRVVAVATGNIWIEGIWQGVSYSGELAITATLVPVPPNNSLEPTRTAGKMATASPF